MSKTPPREWFEENFVHDGQVTYCSECRAIPYLFIGHFCMSLDGRACGIRAERLSVPYRWEDVTPVESGDRPGDWHLEVKP